MAATVNDNHKNGLQHVCGNTRRDFLGERVFAALWALCLIGRRLAARRGQVGSVPQEAAKVPPQGGPKVFQAILKFSVGGRELFGFGFGSGGPTLDCRRLVLAANNSTILRLARARPSHPNCAGSCPSPGLARLAWFSGHGPSRGCLSGPGIRIRLALSLLVSVCCKVCGSLSKFKRLKRQHMLANSGRRWAGHFGLCRHNSWLMLHFVPVIALNRSYLQKLLNKLDHDSVRYVG